MTTTSLKDQIAAAWAEYEVGAWTRDAVAEEAAQRKCIAAITAARAVEVEKDKKP